jgi:hypothetical protein
MLLVSFNQIVFHGEIVLRIHRSFFGHQIPDVPVGSKDMKVLTEKFFDCLGLGWRFDND